LVIAIWPRISLLLNNSKDGTATSPPVPRILGWLDHDVLVGKDVVVAGNEHLGPRTRAEDGTWIGTGVRAGSDVVIARGARVAPDAVVRDSTVVRRRAGWGGPEFRIAA